MSLRELVEAGDRADPHRRGAVRRRRRRSRRSTSGSPRWRTGSDAMNATDNTAAHAHASNVAVAIALAPAPASSRSCRSSAATRTGSRCQADIVGAALHGVENVCCLTGDDVTAGDEPEARRVFDLDGPQLDRASPPVSAQGRYLSGRAIEPAPRALRRRRRERGRARRSSTARERAAKKIEAGARFLQLQICYHPERLRGLRRGARAARPDGARRAPADDRARQGGARLCASWTSTCPGIAVPAETIARVEQAGDPSEAAYQLALEQARQALATARRSRPAPDRLPPRRRRHAPLPRPRHPDARRRESACTPFSAHGLARSSSAPTSRSASSASGSTRPAARRSPRRCAPATCPRSSRTSRSRSAGGAHVLDVNMGVPLTDEADLLVARDRARRRSTPTCRSASTRPSSRRSRPASPSYEGKALVNSVTCEQRPARAGAAARQGARRGRHLPRRTTRPGIPQTADERLEVCKRLVDAVHGDYGDPARGHGDRPAGDDRRRRPAGRRDDARDDRRDPRRVRPQHDARRLEHVLRAAQPPRAERRLPRGRLATPA